MGSNKKRKNGLEKLSPAELAAFHHEPTLKTVEERLAAARRILESGPRFKARVTRDLYRPR